MTAHEWLTHAQNALQEMGVPTARLDALVLLEKATGLDRAHLLAHPDYIVPIAILDRLSDQLERRLQHEPLAYITGTQEFYSRSFSVTPDVLVPRPESEMIIEVLKDLPLPAAAAVVDVGTGSGALAITAALETDQPVTGVDVSQACLEVATANAAALGAAVGFTHSDLLADAPAADVILANLPYVPDGYAINEAAKHEPGLALFGGPDGLDIYRTLFEQAVQLPQKPRWIITESLPDQHEPLAKIARSHGYEQSREVDFVQLFTAA